MLPPYWLVRDTCVGWVFRPDTWLSRRRAPALRGASLHAVGGTECSAIFKLLFSGSLSHLDLVRGDFPGSIGPVGLLRLVVFIYVRARIPGGLVDRLLWSSGSLARPARIESPTNDLWGGSTLVAIVSAQAYSP